MKLTIRWIAQLAIPASTSAAPLALVCKAALVSYVVLFKCISIMILVIISCCCKLGGDSLLFVFVFVFLFVCLWPVSSVIKSSREYMQGALVTLGYNIIQNCTQYLFMLRQYTAL